MSEVIVITSGKGGVGKTTTVANIGTGLAMLGKKVVVVDTDIGLRNLDVVLGLENRIVYNLVDVINGSCRLRQALIKDKRHPELCLLPSAQTKDKSAVSPEQMIKLTDDLREQFDYILLDCPAGIEQGFKNAIAGADKALVVTTPEVSAIRDADRIIGLLEANEIRDISLIINRLRPDMIARGDMMSVDDVTDILAVDLIGTILDDEQIVIATNQGEPLSGFKNAIAGADKALVVTTPEVSAIRDADRIIGLLEANEIRDISLIINRLRPDMIARGDMMSVDDVTDILAVDLIGTILDDEQIVIATNQGEPLSGKSSQAEEEYMNICKRLLGEEIPFADINRKQGLLRKIGSFFKK